MLVYGTHEDKMCEVRSGAWSTQGATKGAFRAIPRMDAPLRVDKTKTIKPLEDSSHGALKALERVDLAS